MPRKASKNFYFHELVPIEIYNRYGDNSRWFIRPEIISLAEFYRSYFDAPVTINNWYWGGDWQWRGYRTPQCSVGSKYSQHRLGCAIDMNIKGITPDEIRNEIMANQDIFMNEGLTTLEHKDYAPTWVHSDIRNTGLKEILIVKP